MTDVDVHKVESTDDRSLPIFSEFDDVLDQIRVRAYKLFHDRGFSEGLDLDDWLRAEREVCWPAAELEEDDKGFELKVALAGFKPKEISVTASPRELIVKASHDSKSAATEKSATHWSEFRSNSVYRRVTLPAEINVDKIDAEVKDGMLEIKAPKAVEKQKQTKKIEVTTAA